MKPILLIILVLLFAFFCSAQRWGNVGGGLSRTLGGMPIIVSMKAYSNELFVSGYFEKAGGNSAYYIARWNGTNWNAAGVDPGNEAIKYVIDDFVIFNNELYAGGRYLGIKRWNGSSWVNFDSTGAHLYSLAVYNNGLYAAGAVVTIGGVSVNRIARWDGSNWADVGGGVTEGFGPPFIQTMAVFKGELYVGGNFGGAGSANLPVRNIARWNGTVWDSCGSGMDDYGGVVSMLVDTVNDILYVGGGFHSAGNVPVHGVAKWDGSNWSAPGMAITNGAYDLEIYKNQLYEGGSNYQTDTVMARCDGQHWYPVIGPNKTVNQLEYFKGKLYVGGEFWKIDTMSVGAIASYEDTINSITKAYNKEAFLGDNIPNPFKNTTTIPYSIPPGKKGVLKICDITGNLINEYLLNPGSNALELDIKGWKDGTYLYSLYIDGFLTESKKMVLLK